MKAVIALAISAVSATLVFSLTAEERKRVCNWVVVTEIGDCQRQTCWFKAPDGLIYTSRSGPLVVGTRVGLPVKLTFLTNAACIYEANGYRLLADPWLSETCFEGAWLHDPPLRAKPEDYADVDALYISHIHPDHCDPETLKYFRRDIPIITLRDANSFCAKHLGRMGFTNVVALSDEQQHTLGPFVLRMFGPFCKRPHGFDCEIGNIVDSALLVEHGDVRVLNTNDNTPSFEAATYLGNKYGPFTVAQLNFNSAGPYPACFDNLTWEQKRAEHFRLIERNLLHMVSVATILKPCYVMPFAGAYKLRDEALNAVLGTTTPEHAAARAQLAGFETIVLAEAEHVDL